MIRSVLLILCTLLVQLNKKGQAGAPAELLEKVTDALVKLVGGLHRA